MDRRDTKRIGIAAAYAPPLAPPPTAEYSQRTMRDDFDSTAASAERLMNAVTRMVRTAHDAVDAQHHDALETWAAQQEQRQTDRRAEVDNQHDERSRRIRSQWKRY